MTQKISIIEKAGLSFIIGIFVTTVGMLVLDLFGVALTAVSIISFQLVMTILFSLSFFCKIRKNLKRPDLKNFALPGLNFIWLVFVVFIIYIEYMNFTKCMYFPTFDRDSLAGFDTMGFITAKEHTYKNLSIFDSSYVPALNGPGSYITYAPMVQLSYAYVYILGAQTSKIIPALIFMFFIISFYGVTRRIARDPLSAIATFFFSITPEIIAFSSLSATNVIQAAYASFGLI